jgi:hypothetical protein
MFSDFPIRDAHPVLSLVPFFNRFASSSLGGILLSAMDVHRKMGQLLPPQESSPIRRKEK